MDYSENMTQQYKFEPQSSYFSKKQFSLQCTVKHLPDSHEYIYHLSNVMTHNYAFTSTVLKYLIEHSSTNIIRIKSDNYPTQYKSKYVFKARHTLAAKTNKRIVTFYRMSSPGKGLVDAISSSGVKVPICKAVLT